MGDGILRPQSGHWDRQIRSIESEINFNCKCKYELSMCVWGVCVCVFQTDTSKSNLFQLSVFGL